MALTRAACAILRLLCSNARDPQIVSLKKHSPMVRGMDVKGAPYTGFLYAGLMIDADGTPESYRIQPPPKDPANATYHDAYGVRPLPSFCLMAIDEKLDEAESK
ncbi:hypothetical protein OH492_02190 [Vibrio chagasii]|nr:hypothetical protein [Vibrio chagasii]